MYNYSSPVSTPRRLSSTAPAATGTTTVPAPPAPSSTSRDRDFHIVFIYDLFRNKNEADDPSDSILYFTPSSIPEEKRVAICGQLMGLTHFMNFNFSSPNLITLGNGKFSLRKLSKEYVLAIGSSSATPDWLISQQSMILVELLGFYNADFTGEILKKSGTGVGAGKTDFKLGFMMDYYLDIVYTNDIFSLSFGILPIVNIPKSAPGVSLKGSLILQTCRLRLGVLGGILMYQNKVVTVEILESIGQKLAFIRQDRIPPGDLVTKYPKLPQRVQLLNVYVKSEEFDELKQMSKKYHIIPNETKPQQSQQLQPKPQTKPNKCELIIEENFTNKEPLDNNHNNNTSTPTPITKLRRCQSLVDIDVQQVQLDIAENNNGKWNSLLNLKDSRDDELDGDGEDSSFEEIDIMKIPNQANLSGLSEQEDGSNAGSSIPEFIRPQSNDCNAESSDCGSSSGPNSFIPEHSTEAHNQSFHKNVPTSPYTNNTSTLSSTESLHSSHYAPSNSLKLKRLSGPERNRPVTKTLDSTTYEHCLLYVFNDGYMRLLLVLDKETEISVIENITSYCESILPELKKELTLVENLDPVQVDPYCFLRYESMWKSLSGGRNNEFMDTHAIQHMHRNFQVYPDINELIIRANDHVMYGYQCVGSEVFYQQRAGLQPGLPMPSDLMGKVPDKAKRRLERDHSILLL